MDVVHIEAKYKPKIMLPEKFLDILPKEVIFFTTVQYLNSLDDMKKQLTDRQINVKLIQPRHTRYKGQILGCSTKQLKDMIGDFIFIGDGFFHPKALLINNDCKVFSYDPKTTHQQIFTQDDASQIRKKVIGAYKKFISSTNIGVLITTKPGQYKERIADKLLEKYPNKKFYYLLDNTHDFQGLKDFPFIDVYVNTMCERIAYDDMDVQGMSIINVEDIFNIENGMFD